MDIKEQKVTVQKAIRTRGLCCVASVKEREPKTVTGWTSHAQTTWQKKRKSQQKEQEDGGERSRGHPVQEGVCERTGGAPWPAQGLSAHIAAHRPRQPADTFRK